MPGFPSKLRFGLLLLTLFAFFILVDFSSLKVYTPPGGGGGGEGGGGGQGQGDDRLRLQQQAEEEEGVANVMDLRRDASEEDKEEEEKDKSDNCQMLRFHTGPSLPLTALVSTPGSGNTWLRHLLQQATGVYTGSVYLDKTLKHNGFPGEGLVGGQVIGVKTHELSSVNIVPFDKVILLVRYPQGSILSEFNRRHANANHTGYAPPHLFNSTVWVRHVNKATEWFVKFIRGWAEFPGPLLLVRYEDLQSNLQKQLLRMLHFLEVKIPSSQVLECVVQKSAGMHKRQHENNNFDPFTDWMKKNMQQAYTLTMSSLQNRKGIKL